MEPRSATDGHNGRIRVRKRRPSRASRRSTVHCPATQISAPARRRRKEGTMRLRSASFRRAYSKLMELVAVPRAIRHGEGSEIGPRAILGVKWEQTDRDFLSNSLIRHKTLSDHGCSLEAWDTYELILMNSWWRWDQRKLRRETAAAALAVACPSHQSIG